MARLAASQFLGHRVTGKGKANGKEARVVARVNEKTKKDAEEILDKLGLSMSDAIGLFLKQLIVKRGIPFSITLDDEEDGKEK
ncbi:type II toxin-antitoxin system RelB/DinJ family antitoxin [Paenibacillus alvei]|nr:type II toxin-antitoxin system RelB/DinJ family antitoxin [Paenibacillus alvei]